jgi:hypothetical protein
MAPDFLASIKTNELDAELSFVGCRAHFEGVRDRLFLRAYFD